MLHILVLLLKIIAVIIAVILGILVLLAGTILFVPIRYEAAARCEGSPDTFRMKGKVTWLMHLVRADGCYKDGKTVWKIRIAWKQVGAGAKKEETSGQEPEEEVRTDNGIKESKETKEGKEVEKADETGPVKEVETLDETGAVKEAEETEAVQETQETAEKAEKEETRSSILEKIKAWFFKIKCTFSRVCDKIKLLGERKDKVLGFLQSEVHKEAFRRVKRETLWLLRCIRPRKGALQVVYGFEDPFTTGQVLAGLSLVYPLIGEYASIVPDFERSVLEGKAWIKGNVRLWHVTAFAWKLFWSRSVRETYRDFKNFEW